ncbi:MAG: acyl-CoA dehydrogenase family protein, partial [Myxococcota bacterium]|nr:acyl-CoA dehydrogenase family protein [Myxococcota bacterium]
MYPVEELLALEAFSELDTELLEIYLETARRFSRERLFPAYRPMDEAPPKLVGGEVAIHPLMHELYPRLVELGTIGATRPESVGGAQLPHLVATLANMYLMAGNAAAVGYTLLTAGAAHLVEIFGDDEVKATFLEPMMSGRWTGTMALTEPQAGSSLADVLATATPTDAGHYLVRGAKIFISGGMQDLTENVVHLTLARIDGAPPGSKGVSLFVVPRRRVGPDGQLVDNDLKATQLIHKIGWRGLPSLGLTYGEDDDCHGWLIGPPNAGLRCMFQMMNEARLMVGANGAATASVAYHEAVAYARERKQGRPASDRDPTKGQRPIIEHADVRRMLLRQRAIVDGAIALVACGARYADVATHGATEAARQE